MKTRLALFIGLLAMVVAASPAQAANIVINGGFETGGFAPWVANPGSSFPWAVGASAPHSGTFAANTGCVGAQCISPDPDPAGAWLYQDLVTVAGTNYNLSFWFDPIGGTPNQLRVLWGPSGGGLTTVFDLVNFAPGYVQYSANVLATSALTRLEFLGRQDPSFLRLDDVIVDSQQVVPEPASLFLLGTGLAGAMIRRRRNQ